MKKILTIFLAIFGGVFGNAAVCVIALLFWGLNAALGVFCGMMSAVAFSALLNAAGNCVRKSGVSRVALLVCTQAPSLTAVAIVLISTYRQMNGVGNSAFTGLGETLASAFFRSELVILAVVVSVTVCAVIAAVNSYLKENHSADNDLWR